MFNTTRSVYRARPLCLTVTWPLWGIKAGSSGPTRFCPTPKAPPLPLQSHRVMCHTPVLPWQEGKQHRLSPFSPSRLTAGGGPAPAPPCPHSIPVHRGEFLSSPLAPPCEYPLYKGQLGRGACGACLVQYGSYVTYSFWLFVFILLLGDNDRGTCTSTHEPNRHTQETWAVWKGVMLLPWLPENIQKLHVRWHSLSASLMCAYASVCMYVWQTVCPFYGRPVEFHCCVPRWIAFPGKLFLEDKIPSTFLSLLEWGDGSV